jgi:hypothetical protein
VISTAVLLQDGPEKVLRQLSTQASA